MKETNVRPAQFPRHAIILSIMALLGTPPLRGELLKIKPGDVGIVPITVHNESESAPMENVSVNAALPSAFIPVEVGQPVNIPPGGTHVFEYRFQVSTEVTQSGIFRTIHNITTTTGELVPDITKKQYTTFWQLDVDNIAPQVVVNREKSSASGQPGSWNAQISVSLADGGGFKALELWNASAAGAPTDLLSSINVAGVTNTEMMVPVPFSSISTTPTSFVLRSQDNAGNSGADQKFTLLNGGGGGVGTSFSNATGPGVFTDSFSADYLKAGGRLAGFTNSGGNCGGTITGGGNFETDIVEGPEFPPSTTYIPLVRMELEVATSDVDPMPSNFTAVGGSDISVLPFSNFAATSVPHGFSGGFAVKRYLRGKITTSSLGGLVPWQSFVECPNGAESCSNPTTRYMYWKAGIFFLNSGGCGTNGVSLNIDRPELNTPVGNDISAPLSFGNIVFGEVLQTPSGDGGGYTGMTLTGASSSGSLDTVPPGQAFKIETTANAHGTAQVSISFGSFIPGTATPSRIAGIQLASLSGAAPSGISLSNGQVTFNVIVNGPGPIGTYSLTLPADVDPPSAVQALTATKLPDSRVRLEFTAPGSDANSGQADEIEIEMRRDGALFDTITVPASAPGARQIVETDQLPLGAYSFNLTASDPQGNVGPTATAGTTFNNDLAAGPTVGSHPEASLSAAQAANLVVIPSSEPRTSELTQMASVRGLRPVSMAYSAVAQEGVFYSTPTLTMSYEVESALDENSFAIYGSTGPGSFVLLSQIADRSGKTIVAELDRSTGTIFAIFSSTPAVSDDMVPPVSTISYINTTIQQSGDWVLLSDSALVQYSATDPLVFGSTTSGAFAVYYWVDVPTTTNPREGAVPPVEYSNPFALSSGSHTLAYFSIDLAGNAEDVRFARLVVGPQSNDTFPPRTAIVAGYPSVSSATTIYVSSLSLVGFITVDDSRIINDALGVGATQTFYARDGGAYTRFTSSFSIGVEGAHSLSFFSIDSVGNEEIPSQKSIFVDLTPPVTQLNQNGAGISLSAFDPNISGGNSGVARIRYLVDFTNPGVCNNVVEDTSAARGTCENPWYAGPFTLSNGPHTLAFQSVDSVGNMESLQIAYPYVDAGGSGPSLGGMGIGKDGFDAFWTVVSENNALAFAHSNSSGALISSSTLQDAQSGFPWSVFFAPDGRAYAIGGAAGPTTQALDLAVYKASPNGDAIESRTLFDSGYANNDLAFDAKAPGWIVGAAQTSGPTDLEAAGAGAFSMALWRFDPALGTVQLKTTYARAGFDLGSGIAVDADGSLWIAGYSLSPEAPAVGGFDLALWHYAADGQTLLGGPFLRTGYLNDLDGGLTARVFVSSQAVYVAASRANNSGGTDMAFLRYDKATGQPTVEKAWRTASGEPSYPIAILPEASGLLVVGGIGANFTEAALWRFGYDGALLSATKADAGGAEGAVFRGNELWLSVDGSTVPYHVQAEVPAAGFLIDIQPPRTSLTVGAPQFVAGQMVYVTSATRLGFSVVDDNTVLGDGLGVGATQTFYATDGGAYARFTSSFTLVAEGTHTLSFFSIDREGHAEAAKTRSVGVDLTVPVVTLVSSGSVFTIIAVDPVVGGAASGVDLIQYIVDHSPDCPEAPQSTAAAPGTCENPVYAGPFELAVGTHTVYFAATDRVLNGGEVVSSSFVTVGQPVLGLGLMPSSGPIGVPFTITGTGFGVYAGANTRVKFGTLAAPLSVWNDTTISGTVPGLSTGAYAVTVERQFVSSTGVTAAGIFQVTALNPTALSVSSGPIGMPFTITGSGFGPYAGTLTRVLVGGTTAPLSVWNDTTITGTIPGVSAGVQTLIIQRASSDGGLIAANLQPFTVTVPVISTAIPTSGPIGNGFILSGTSFGPYAGSLTVVLIGGATAPLSVWNDATITGTVPGSLAPGTYSLIAQRRTSDGGVVASNAVGFTVVAPFGASLSVSSGPIGMPFTITGTGFGTYGGANTVVLIGGATAPLSVWNDTTITGTVPGLAAGAYPVIIERIQGGSISSSTVGAFTVVPLQVFTLTPSSGPIGVSFTLSGAGFGPYAGANTRVKFGGVLAPLSLWNDTTITGTIPALAEGIFNVVVERQQGDDTAMSDVSSFTVLGLSVSSVTPASGPIGTAFTIKGSGFGPYAGANTRALVGGVAAALSVWNDTTITGTIPNLPAGVQPVWLERSAGTGVSSSATSYFNITTPALASLTPSSAPIGAPFTITGTSFGAYAGSNTRVKFSGVVAPLSVWNDTTISGTVPGSLSPGSVEVVIERVAGAGLTMSATQAFLVLVPSISTVSPSFGPAGTVVTLTGTGFGPYAGTLTTVLVGGATVPLSVWNDSTIRWTVPSSLANAVYPVVIHRSPAGGTVDSASATFTVGTGLGGASFGFAAALSLAATPDSHFEGDMSLSSATGGRIDTPAKAAVDIPANAMDADTEITLKRIHSDGLRVRAAEEIKMRAAGEPIEFGPEGTRFNTPVTIELPYDPALTADETKIAIHYFNPLRREWEELPSVVDRVRKVVTAKTDHFSIYQPMGLAPMTAAQDEFYFRDVYAFPSPSRGGALVTFRIQPGLAETVEVRVYDLSGRKIHDSSDFTFRGAVDDGNGKGAQNTYDHAWSVSGVGSGVYTYVIKASQRGQKPIVKSGKVGVIR